MNITNMITFTSAEAHKEALVMAEKASSTWADHARETVTRPSPVHAVRSTSYTLEKGLSIAMALLTGCLLQENAIRQACRDAV